MSDLNTIIYYVAKKYREHLNEGETDRWLVKSATHIALARIIIISELRISTIVVIYTIFSVI